MAVEYKGSSGGNKNCEELHDASEASNNAAYQAGKTIGRVVGNKGSKANRSFSIIVASISILLLVVLVLAFAANCSGKNGEVQAPISSSGAQGKNYQDVALRFEKAGFTNVSTEPMGDLILGILSKDNAVDTISIDGDETFSKGAGYNADAAVVIRYHSFPSRTNSNGASSGTSSKGESDAPASNETSSQSSSSSGNVSSSSSSSEASASSDQQSGTDVSALRERVKGYVGQELTSVCSQLKAEGIAFKLVHAVTNLDMTSSYETGDFDDGGMVVTGTYVDSSGTVTLSIKSYDAIARDQAKENLENKLHVTNAWAAVELYGKEAFPYGFKMHLVTGLLAEEKRDENTWFLKASCDVTNAYGQTARGLTCEALVTGTSDNPQVISFYVY